MKKVLAWLTPLAGSLPGAPTSEASYRANSDLIDAVTGWQGPIANDGTWWRGTPDAGSFGETIPLLARAAGHDYMCPFMFTSQVDQQDVLNDPARWIVSAASAVRLATTDWDAPWNAVMYSHEGQDPAYKALMGQYLQVVSAAVREAGLPFAVAQPCAVDGFYDDWLLDLDDVAAVADLYVGYAYGYKYPSLDSPHGPYWWAEQSIHDAKAHGIAPENMYLGFPTHSKYYPNVASTAIEYRTYDAATSLVEVSGGSQAWVESDSDGLVRETRGTVGIGSIWIADVAMTRYRLRLADQYGLAGTFIFTPGMEDPAIWQAVEAWKWPAPPVRARRSSRRGRTTNWRKFAQ